MNASCKREKKKAVDERACMPAGGKERTGGIHSPKRWKVCYGMGNLMTSWGEWTWGHGGTAPIQRPVHFALLTLPSHQHRDARNPSPPLPAQSTLQARRHTPQFCFLIKRHFQMLLRKWISTNKLMRIMDATDRMRTHGKQFKVTAKENTF